MSVFKKEYTIHVDKGVAESKAVFENCFQNMAKKGYSGSTVIHHSDYGMKKFTGTVADDGTYRARLILSDDVVSSYRSAPVNEMIFSGNESETVVDVSVSTVKYGIIFISIIAAAIVLLCIAFMFLSELSVFILFAVVAAALFLFSFIPVFIANYRVKSAKETLYYILKYKDKF